MKFSIVTPLYNKEKYIAETIDSVLGQTFGDFEMIIVDDSSTDRSAEIVQYYNDPRIKLSSKPNGGVSSARNFGIARAKGEIVCFLDADDLWEPRYLEEIASMVEKFPDVDFFCTAYNSFIGDVKNVVGHTNLKKFTTDEVLVTDFFAMSLKNKSSIALTSAVSIKRERLLKLDKWFNEAKSMGEDNDLWVRVALYTKVAYNNNPLMMYRLFASGGITASKPNIEKSVDYSSYYGYSNNKMLHQFATLMLYTLAQRCYKQQQYDDAKKCLKKVKGDYLLWRRLILIGCVYFKSIHI